MSVCVSHSYYYEDAESDAPKVFALMMIVAGSAIEIGSALDVCTFS